MAKRGLFLGLAILVATGAAAFAEGGIEVTMNNAKVVRLPRAADTIIIGNPEIADAAVQDPTTIVLTGKGFGVTNLVIFDEEGTPIVDDRITVSRSTASTVRIYRRSSVQTLSCTPYCEGAYRSNAERISESELNSQ